MLSQAGFNKELAYQYLSSSTQSRCSINSTYI